jgi:Luciferase
VADDFLDFKRTLTSILAQGINRGSERQRTMNDDRNKVLVADPAVDVYVAPSAVTARAAIDAVRATVAGWRGVTTQEHRFGGIEFRLGRREIGHVHGLFADLPFPRQVRDELVAAGRARPHHVLPDSGWVTVPMRTGSDVAGVIELFRRSYERAASADRRAQTPRRTGRV